MFIHPLSELHDHPNDPNDELINVWAFASMAADALQEHGIDAPAYELSRTLLGDSEATLLLLNKVIAGDQEALRTFINKFAFEVEARANEALGL